MLTLNGERAALWRAWKRRDENYLAVARECRNVGIHWKNCKMLIRAKRNAGERITVAAWAKVHAPVSDRWLDKYAEFSSRWENFGRMEVDADAAIRIDDRACSFFDRSAVVGQLCPRQAAPSQAMPVTELVRKAGLQQANR